MDNSKNTKKIDNYTYDSKSLLKNSKRFFPVMGEIHYSRYPEQYWKEALLKMKAGGVVIVSSYTIWIHHEEIENNWDFSGSRNLRKFVQLIQECNLKMCLRIGPWVHAEVRNGGFPDENPLKPENSPDLRKSFRFNKNGTSYVFVNNYQRLQKMAEHKNVILKEEFAPVDIKDGDFFFLPINMKLKNSLLKSALVSPLCKLDDESFVFYSATRPANQNLLEKSNVSNVKNASSTFYNFSTKDGNETIITLSREDALKSHKILDKNKKAHLIISDSEVYETEAGEIKIAATKNTFLKVYPEFDFVPENLIFQGSENGFAFYKVNFADFKTADVQWKILQPSSPLLANAKNVPAPQKIQAAPENVSNVPEKFSVNAKSSAEEKSAENTKSKNTLSFSVKISNIPQNANDILLDISYVGNCARLYKNQKLIDDQIFTGTNYKWTVGLKRFSLEEQEFTLEIDALEKNQKANTYLEKWPDFASKEKLLELFKIETRTEQSLKIIL